MRKHGWLIVAFALLASTARAEVVEEIVAKVNDDIITKSDLETEEQGILQELYRRYSGPELDAQVKTAKDGLLRNLIDRRVLLQRAGRLFDMSKMQDYFLQSFKEQQNIKSDKDLERMLAQEGTTLPAWKKKLVEYFAPQQVLRAEVADRIAISDAELLAYYDTHIPEFTVFGESTVREIVIKADAENREAKRAEAEAIRAKAAAPGADFAAIAQESSESGTKSAGGLLGNVKQGDLAEELDRLAFGLPIGGVSSVIEMPFGFHILRVDARADDVVKPFEEVRSGIEGTLRDREMQKQTATYLKRIWSETSVWVAPTYQARLSPLPATP
jgi:peptidyl-prolyl cis-trans isomerase SurA